MVLSFKKTRLFNYVESILKRSCILAVITAIAIIHFGPGVLQAQSGTPVNHAFPGEISSFEVIEVVGRFDIDGTSTNFHGLDSIAVFQTVYGDPELWFSNGAYSWNFRFPEWDNIDLYPRRATVSDGRLYFGAVVDGNRELWSTDGTEEGTRSEGAQTEDDFSSIREIIPYGDGIAFWGSSASEPDDHVYLFNSKTDGILKVDNVSHNMVGISPGMIEVLDSMLYVPEEDGNARHLVSITKDGDATRVWEMPDNGSADRSIRDLTVAGDYLFFEGNDGQGNALWAFQDGTAQALHSPDPDDKQHRNVRTPTTVGDYVYFFSDPWNHEDDNFYIFDSGLYYSDGSGTTRIQNSSFDFIRQNDASNIDMVAAGDFLLFGVPRYSSADPDGVWWKAGSTPESLQPLEYNGEYISSGSDELGSTGDGAWFFGDDIYFLDGTSSEIYAVDSEDLTLRQNMGIVDNKPWFAGRTSFSGDNGVWRVGEVIPPPSPVALGSPADETSGVELLPTITWSESDEAETYRIQVATSQFFPPSRIVVDELVETTSYEISQELEYETEYYWQVRVEGMGGVSEWSETRSFTTQSPPQPPSQVSLLAPEDGDEEIPLTPELQWSEVDDADTYQLHLAADSIFSEPTLDTLSTTVSISVPDSLDELTTYWWRVRAVNDHGEGEWSAFRNFTTLEAIPDPGQVTLSYPEADAEEIPLIPQMVWHAANHAETFMIQLSADSLFSEVLIDSILADTSLTLDVELDPNSLYWWRVRAENEAGTGDWSNARSFTTVVPTSASPPKDRPVVVALKQNYPNPFNPETTIGFDLPEASEVRLDVYDMLGRRVAVLVSEREEAGRHQVHFDASHLSSGIYIYRLQAGAKTFTRTMTLMK